MKIKYLIISSTVLFIILVFISYIIALQNELDRYEKIMTEFNIDAFIRYPELFEDDFIDQTKVHNCMEYLDLDY